MHSLLCPGSIVKCLPSHSNINDKNSNLQCTLRRLLAASCSLSAVAPFVSKEWQLYHVDLGASSCVLIFMLCQLSVPQLREVDQASLRDSQGSILLAQGARPPASKR